MSALSRRSLLMAAAGSAAALPAIAATKAEPLDVPLLSIEAQLEACIAELKRVLKQIHPNVDEVLHRYAALGDGYSFSCTGYAPPVVEWNGEGIYEIETGPDSGAGVYHIARRWADMDRKWMLWGGYLFEGEMVGPRVTIEPWQIIRKLEGGA